MYRIYRNSDTTAAYNVEIVANFLSDVPTLPTEYASGSTCIVIEDGSVWMLDAGHEVTDPETGEITIAKEWHKI